MTQLLLIANSPLGPLIHGLRVAATLKARRPEIRVSMIVRDLFVPLVRACEAVDQVFVFKRQGGVSDFLALMNEVRATEFDFVFDFDGLLRSGLMTWRSNAKRKVGRTDSREGSSVFYQETAPLPAVPPPAPSGPARHRYHELDVLLQFCPLLDVPAQLAGGPLGFREPEDLNLDFAAGRTSAHPIVMFPGARRSEKAWPGFKALTDAITRDGTGRKVIWAGNDYVDFKEPPASDLFLNLTGNTSLVSLPALLRRASWVIANDGGALQLAAAVGTPCIGIFGPTNPLVTGPYPLNAPSHHVIQAPVGNLRLLSAKDVYRRFRQLEGTPLPPSTLALG